MSAESLTGLCEEANELALALACESRNAESDTIHRLAAKARDLDVECDQWESDWTKVSEERTTLLEKVADLTRWEWLPRGRGVSLCRGGIGVISVWLAPNGWSLRWLDDGQVIDRIVDEQSARNTAEQIARSRGFLGAGEVVK